MRVGLRSFFHLFLCYMFLFSFSLSAFSVSDPDLDNTINVGDPGIKKIKIAIPKFVFTESYPSVKAEALTDRFASILDFTTWFEFISDDKMKPIEKAALEPFDAAAWTAIDAEYVVYGKATGIKNKNLFNLELKLYNVKNRSMAIGKVYHNLTSRLVDVALRRFGDVLINNLTGVPGPFMSHIAFVGKKDLNSKSSQIFVSDFDGSNIVQITHNNSVNISPAWAPDGTKLTYTSFETGRPEIYQYNLITKKTFRMTDNQEGSSSGASWSSDGNMLAFSAGTDEGNTHIFSISAHGGKKKPFIYTSEIEVEPSFSPNGQNLAYTSNKYGKPMIFLWSLQKKEAKRLTYAGWYNASASWTPDSTEISFASYDRQIDRWDIFKIRVDGSNLERLTLKRGDNEKPTWSPDGRFILFQSNRGSGGVDAIGGPAHLYVMSKDGYHQRMLDVPLAEARQPTWGPRVDQILNVDE